MRAFFQLVTVRFLMFALLSAATNCGSLRKFHRTGNAAGDTAKIPLGTAAAIVLRSTVVATAKAPVTASVTGARMCYERTYAFVRGAPPNVLAGIGDDASLLPSPGSEEFETLLDREGLAERSTGRVQFLVDGPSFFRALHGAIHDATKSIDLQFYIFDNDRVAVNVAGHLKQKSSEVPVRVLYDPAGSEMAFKMNEPVAPAPEFKSVSALMSQMSRNSGVQVRATSDPYFVSDHTKLVVIDRSVAFIGGMNVGAEYRYQWHDMMERIDGPVVEQMSRVFDTHWNGEDWARQWGLRGWNEKKTPSPSVPPDRASTQRHMPLRMLLTDLPPGKREVLKATLAAIRCARERVWIESPYFAADDITAEVARAVKRGVDVRVIIPGAVDAKFMQKVNLVELRDLLKSGAKVYEYPGMTHLKATICDGWATFGSANYDTLSMRINRELNVSTADPATVQDLIEKVFKPDLRASSRLTLEKASARGGPLTEILGDQM